MNRGWSAAHIARKIAETRAKLESERKYAEASKGKQREKALTRVRRLGGSLRHWESKAEQAARRELQIKLEAEQALLRAEAERDAEHAAEQSLSVKAFLETRR